MTGPAQERPDEAGAHDRPGGQPGVGAAPSGATDRPGGSADSSGPTTGAPVQRRSVLRNPEKAVRGLGAGTLALEALVLLLAIQPIRVVGGDLSGAAIGAIVTLAVACVVLAGRMGRAWAWHAGTVLQGLLMLSGLLHWSLLVLGVIFALVWAYALHVRRVILG